MGPCRRHLELRLHLDAVWRAVLAALATKSLFRGSRVEHKQRTTTGKFLFRPLRVNSKQGQYKDREQRFKQRPGPQTGPLLLVGTTAMCRPG